VPLDPPRLRETEIEPACDLPSRERPCGAETSAQAKDAPLAWAEVREALSSVLDRELQLSLGGDRPAGRMAGRLVDGEAITTDARGVC